MKLKTFKAWLNEDEKYVAHMTHLSDMLFMFGVSGAKRAVDYLRDMRHMFTRSSKNRYTVKFDGAPAVILGIDPTDGKFFVAKKGIFNKTPKVYKTQADITADLSGELANKFAQLLTYTSKLGITSGIYQGDLMYTHEDLKTETIDGDKMVVFHPNTIVYAVPENTELAKKIKASKLGIVFHTTYTGSSFDKLKASFGKNIVGKFKSIPEVWAIDATVDNATAAFTLSDGEYVTSELLLKEIGQQFQKINSEMLNRIAADPDLSSIVLIYINSLVRRNIKNLSGTQLSVGFYDFIHSRFQKEIDALKTDKSRLMRQDKRARALQYFEDHGHGEIGKIFELALSIDLLKDLLLTKMRHIEGISHFLKTKDGYRVTNPEGFVAIDGNAAVKLVDRFEFSQANFSDDIIKGFEKTR
jgi:hypothetical protein